MLYNYDPETKKAKLHVRFKEIREKLDKVGWNSLTDEMIEQLQNYYLCEQVMFALHVEFEEEEIEQALLADWKEPKEPVV